ncbi:hypothetical protein [Hoeflea sp. TYP-13]|uniref:hypothetical protein n=1 Tax=Hoeflea sp. TYP-13 TaxID=3230023 RepID=UPI0034C6BF72
MKIIIGTAVLVFAMTASASVVAQGNIVSGNQLKKLISGKCASYADRSAGTMCFKRNGKIVYDDREYGEGVGKWYFKGNSVCQIYPDSKEDSGCARMIKTKGKGRYKDEMGTSYRFH